MNPRLRVSLYPKYRRSKKGKLIENLGSVLICVVLIIMSHERPFEIVKTKHFMSINETASANDYLQKGLDYLSGKDYQEAITHFDKVLELNGKAESIDVGLKRKTNIDAIGSAELSKNKSIRHEQNFSAVYHRGIAFSAVRNEEEAIRSFTRAIKLKPRTSEVIFRRALIFQGMRKYEEAAIDYTRVIELEPDNFEAFFNRASCHSGRNARKYQIEDLSKAIELKPDFPRAYYERAEVFRLDKLFDEGLGDYTKVIELDPGFTGAYYGRGAIFQRLGDTPRAVEECNKLQQIEPGSRCFCRHHANYVEPKFVPEPCRLCPCADFSEAHMSDPLCVCGHLYKMHG
jgi:tetratricopeptide (TPR) repeat protein